MTKLVSRIASAVAILCLSGPAFAAPSSAPTTAPAPATKTSVVHQSGHGKVAAADTKKADPKKVESKKAHVKSTPKAKTPPAPSATPAPAPR